MHESLKLGGFKMKLLQASIAVIAISLCVVGCKKTVTKTVTENTTMNAATMAPANSVDTNNMAAPDNATGNGDREDTGPRG